jgi:hypothetical protein
MDFLSPKDIKTFVRAQRTECLNEPESPSCWRPQIIQGDEEVEEVEEDVGDEEDEEDVGDEENEEDEEDEEAEEDEEDVGDEENEEDEEDEEAEEDEEDEGYESSSGNLPPPTQAASTQTEPPPSLPPFAALALALTPNRVQTPPPPSTTPGLMQSVSAAATSYRPPDAKDPITFLNQVRVQFQERPDDYDKFLDILKDYKNQRYITSATLLIVVSILPASLILSPLCSVVIQISSRVSTSSSLPDIASSDPTT